MLLELLKWWLKSWNWWIEIAVNFVFNLKIFHSKARLFLFYCFLRFIVGNDALILVFIVFRWSVSQWLGVQCGDQTNLNIVFILLAAKKNTYHILRIGQLRLNSCTADAVAVCKAKMLDMKPKWTLLEHLTVSHNSNLVWQHGFILRATACHISNDLV